MSTPEIMREARRVLTVCNACGYCNGFCDLFDAARRRAALRDGDLRHLASLCHACRSCLYACQYAPPHGFGVNVPRALARLRHQSFAGYTWPPALSGLFERSLPATLALGLGVMLALMALVVMTVPSDVLFGRSADPGAFYRIIPWPAMVLLGALPLGWTLIVTAVGLRRYWRDARTGAAPVTARALSTALWNLIRMRNLGGGGPGCAELGRPASHARRWLHQLMVGGVLSSFAATLVATCYDHVLGWQAPYPLASAPVMLGTLGGFAMIGGIAGLLWLERRADPAPTSPEVRAADIALLLLLLAVAATGLALLAWRDTAAMGLLLAAHLGCVLTLFLLAPYSKLVHAGYRFLALLIDAAERTERPRADGRDSRDSSSLPGR